VGAMSTTSFSRVLTSPAGRGDRHRLLGAPRSASPYGLTTPLCQRPRAAGPLPSSLPGVCRHFHPHRCRARATGALRLKIPGVATPGRGQQELAPNRSGGRAARDDLIPGYPAGVSPALLSTASSLAAAIRTHGLGSQRAVRGKHQFRLRAHLQGRGDSHLSGKRTGISFLIGLSGTKMPRSRLAGPTLSMSQRGSIFIRFYVWPRHRAS
jgi:hypothetical protein